MADSKITALTAISTVDPTADPLVIVDVSDTSMAASGTTKKSTINQLLGSGGTATLASATITGDLTVDTSTLKVDSANNRVIVGHTSGSSAFQVTNAGAAGLEIQPTGFSSAPLILSYNRSGSAYTQLTLDGSTIVHALSGSTAMTLNSTGLGVGVVPYVSWPATSKALQLGASSAIEGRTNDGSRTSLYTNAVWNGTNLIYQNTAAASYYLQSSGVHSWYTAPSGTAGNNITFTQAMTLDASGNLLLATTTNTPSARQYINQASGSNPALYIAGGASTTPLINFNGAGRVRSDGQYLVMETTNASGVIYVTANTNGVYLTVGGTSWTANSDERLKDIIEPINNAVAKVGSLRSVIGKFKNDETNTRRSFLIAQDVQAVLPEAVDASNPDRLGVAYPEVIPLLVAAIKELTARVQTLETR